MTKQEGFFKLYNNNRLHKHIVWAPCVLTNFVVFDIVKLTDFLLKQSDFRKKKACYLNGVYPVFNTL